MFCIKDVGDTTTHTRCKVTPGLSEYDHTATRHIFTSVITNTFYYRFHTGVTNAETLTGLTADKGFTCSGPVKRNVANDNIILRLERGFFIRIDNELST